ncbi:MAG: lipoprotein [Pseudomonadota bacterium]|nr:lipoprotein [Pseudomonadota bacterium]
MNLPARYFAAAALLTLAACGNKGPLVKPSQIPATQGAPVTPADTSPSSGDPTGTAPVEDEVPATLDPATPVPPVAPLPGDGHG